MPSPIDICPGGTVNSGAGRPGQGAPVKATPSVRVRAVGLAGEPLHLDQAEPGLRRRPGDLEDGQIPGDTAPVGHLVERGTGNIVGDDHGAGVDAFSPQALLRLAELHPVAGVVAIAEQHPSSAIDGPRHPVGLPGGRRSKYLAAHRRGGQAGPTSPAKAG